METKRDKYGENKHVRCWVLKPEAETERLKDRNRDRVRPELTGWLRTENFCVPWSLIETSESSQIWMPPGGPEESGEHSTEDSPPTPAALTSCTLGSLDQANSYSPFLAPSTVQDARMPRARSTMKEKKLLNFMVKAEWLRWPVPSITLYIFSSGRGSSGVYLDPPSCYCIVRKLSQRTKVLILQQ